MVRPLSFVQVPQYLTQPHSQIHNGSHVPSPGFRLTAGRSVEGGDFFLGLEAYKAFLACLPACRAIPFDSSELWLEPDPSRQRASFPLPCLQAAARPPRRGWHLAGGRR
uniref:Uncharacterized protein n=1 Tax=Hordeum vulgare subsp. vulgare TaxID=112509 RepID=A0A8I6XJ49_HORVV